MILTVSPASFINAFIGWGETGMSWYLDESAIHEDAESDLAIRRQHLQRVAHITLRSVGRSEPLLPRDAPRSSSGKFWWRLDHLSLIPARVKHRCIRHI